MTNATLSKATGEMRVYNRNKELAHNVVAMSNSNKNYLRLLGFSWDRHNHSYFRENTPPDIVEKIKALVPAREY